METRTSVPWMRRLAASGLATAIAVGFLAVTAVPASADSGNALTPRAFNVNREVTDADGVRQTLELAITVRALSPREVRARGLVASGAKVGVRAPRIIDARSGEARGSGAIAPEPVQRSANDRIGIMATYCWDGHWKQGRGSGIFALYVVTDITWCATDTWISSTWTGCYGIDGGYPTYEFNGCTQYQAYGVGWSAWDVQTVGYLCILWYSWCAATVTERAKFRMNGFGAMSLMSYSGDYPQVWR